MRDSRTRPDRVVILNAPRTASNYLCTLLNSHPDILCHHELFNPHVIGVARLMLGFPGVSDANAAEMAGESWQLISTSLLDVISNFDELAAALRETEKEAELHLPSLC